MTKELERRVVTIKGLVQGVGFRPFIYNLAQQYELRGWVNNTTAGVKIDVQGSLRSIVHFINQLKTNAPPLAQIEKVSIEHKPIKTYQQFTIEESSRENKQLTFLSPDATICTQCKKELFDSEDRRYNYPFINCTNCGPRFSIIKGLPYDRAKTTMADFTMCEQCQSEYQDPSSRRFHAQPNSCPDCGPKLKLVDQSGSQLEVEDPIKETIKLLKRAKIIAVKGLGGFHLICDASNPQAITRLRIKKNRSDKALAVMIEDLATVKKYCQVNAKEADILQGVQKPILLLKKKKRFAKSSLAQVIAPDTNSLGVMLPYTPLHLLLSKKLEVMVVTSANLSGLPLEYDNSSAQENLSAVADYYLLHNRNIKTAVDDSVSRVVLDEEQVIRHARGFAPQVIKVKQGLATLACGSDLKNTFCLSNGKFAFLSHYTGSLKNLESYQRFKDNIDHYQNLYQIEPQLIAHDLHPSYYTTQYAKKLLGKKVAVQHHHAHLVSCMVEHQIEGPAIGIAFDGLGLGTDGNLWGGEFFICDYSDFMRVGHLNYLAQPGGDKAVKEPWRMAVSYLVDSRLEGIVDEMKIFKSRATKEVVKMIEQDINSPETSSIGRLFAAVAALLGLCSKRSYRGQAALKLETIAQRSNITASYDYQLTKQEGQYQILTASLITAIVNDLNLGVAKNIIARKFHNTVINFTVRLCQLLKYRFQLRQVVLSGGVWQNQILLTGVYQSLTQLGFKVYFPTTIPCTDQGLAVGQLVIANYKYGGYKL